MRRCCSIRTTYLAVERLYLSWVLTLLLMAFKGLAVKRQSLYDGCALTHWQIVGCRILEGKHSLLKAIRRLSTYSSSWVATTSNKHHDLLYVPTTLTLVVQLDHTDLSAPHKVIYRTIEFFVANVAKSLGKESVFWTTIVVPHTLFCCTALQLPRHHLHVARAIYTVSKSSHL